MIKKGSLIFGRFQPPTIGHEHMINTALKGGGDLWVFVSATEDKKKNPLSSDFRCDILKQMFGNKIHTFPCKKGVNPNTIISALSYLSDKYNEMTIYCGKDRLPEYERIVNNYNGKDFFFDKIDVKSTGERDPDSEDSIIGISATAVRNFALEGNFEKFKKGISSKVYPNTVKDMYEEIREKLGNNK